jgi:hypothetical protein
MDNAGQDRIWHFEHHNIEQHPHHANGYAEQIDGQRVPPVTPRPPAAMPPVAMPPVAKPPVTPVPPFRPQPPLPPTAPAVPVPPVPPPYGRLSPRMAAAAQEILDQLRYIRAELALLDRALREEEPRRRIADLISIKDRSLFLAETLFRDLTGFLPLDNAPDLHGVNFGDTAAALRRLSLNQRALNEKLTALRRFFNTSPITERLNGILNDEINSARIINNLLARGSGQSACRHLRF